MILAALDIVFYSRLANSAPLIPLLCNRQEAFRLVRHLGSYWYEWAFGGPWLDGKPVFRIKISDRAAAWILAALASDRTLSASPAVPQWLASAVVAAPPGDAKDTVRWLSPVLRLRDQENCLTLPGFMAAYLAGRKLSFGLPHADWLRLTRRGAPQPAEAGSPNELPRSNEPIKSEEVTLDYFGAYRKTGEVRKEDALRLCQELFKRITKILSLSSADGDHDPSAHGERPIHANDRKASAIAKAAKRSGFGHGDAPFLLAHFLVHLLTRAPKQGQRDRLRATTALRYWHSLAAPFNDAVADRCLIGAEEEELTLWYADIVRAADPDRGDASTGTPASSDSASRTLAQLQEFHEFVRDAYGLEDPDWSEISAESRAPAGRPGIVLLNEYLCALQTVLPNASAFQDPASLRRGLILVGGYRFGLRLSESLGLRRRDWIEAGSTTLVAVESNRWRPLKTPASRRIVPLREDVTPIERTLIEAVKRQWQQTHELDDATALLPGVNRSDFQRLKAAESSALLDVLKAVTRNHKTTVHQLRHSFATRLTADLFGMPLEDSPAQDPMHSAMQRKLFSGNADLDRRTLWAVARALGHTSVATSLMSYIHSIPLWLAPPSTPADIGRTGRSAKPVDACSRETWSKVIDLDRLAVDTDYLREPIEMVATPLPEVVDDGRPSFIGGLECLRLMLIGKPEAELHRASGLSEPQVARLGAALAQASERIAARATRYAGYKVLGGTPPHRLRDHIERATRRVDAGLPAPVTCGDWLDTVGASRQVLGFSPEHLLAMASFVDWLDFDAGDLLLVHPRSIQRALLDDIETAGLTPLLAHIDKVPIAGSRHAKAFQIDVVRAGPRGVMHPQRVALVPRPGGKLVDTYELLSLWMIWNVCADDVRKATQAR